MRLLNFCVVVLLVLATAYVYKIKFDATLRATRVAEMRNEVQRETDAIAALRAEIARLENPSRLEGLASRHLKLRMPEQWQFDQLNNLPDKPPEGVAPPKGDAISADAHGKDQDIPTGSIPAAPKAVRNELPQAR